MSVPLFQKECVSSSSSSSSQPVKPPSSDLATASSAALLRPGLPATPASRSMITMQHRAWLAVVVIHCHMNTVLSCTYCTPYVCTKRFQLAGPEDGNSIPKAQQSNLRRASGRLWKACSPRQQRIVLPADWTFGNIRLRIPLPSCFWSSDPRRLVVAAKLGPQSHWRDCDHQFCQAAAICTTHQVSVRREGQTAGWLHMVSS